MDVYFFLTINIQLSEPFFIFLDKSANAAYAQTYIRQAHTPHPQKQTFSMVFTIKFLLGDTAVVSNRGHCGYAFLSRESQALVWPVGRTVISNE